MLLRLMLVALFGTAIFGLAGIVTQAAPPERGGYDYFIVGNPADVTVNTQSLLALQGGGTVDEAFHRMAARAPGGDWVVLDAFGRDELAQYIWAQGINADSVETIVVNTRKGASEPFVIQTVRNAEAIWIAGGDQSNYVDHWKDTPLEDAINYVANVKHGPIGGNSAGAAIMSEIVYSAQSASSLTSTEGLADPFHRDLTLVRDFLALPNMFGIIADQHVEERDRIGRTVTFLARIVTDGWTAPGDGKAIAIDRETVVLVEPNGTATILANRGHKTPFAWFMRTPGPPEVCRPKTPLTFHNVAVYRLGPGQGSFDLNSWTGTGGISYTLSAEAGVLTSSRGSIY
jgi:cyanophycinase